MYKKVQLPVSSGIYALTYIPKLATCPLQPVPVRRLDYVSLEPFQDYLTGVTLDNKRLIFGSFQVVVYRYSIDPSDIYME
jgi:hypothetical protein